MTIGQRKRSIVCVAAIAAVAGSQRLMAASSSWVGSANAVDAWATDANWSPVGAPGANDGTMVSTDTATFGGTPTSVTISIDQNRNIGNIVFDNTSTRFTIGSTGGPALLLSSGGAMTLNDTLTLLGGTSAVTQTIAAPVVIDHSFTILDNVVSQNTAGGVNLAGGVTGSINGPATLFLDGGNNAGVTVGVAQINSVISDGPGGPLGIVKNGTGTWDIRATATTPDTYSGDTVVNGGILRFSTNPGSASVNSRIIVNPGGRVQLSSNGQTIGAITLFAGSSLTPSNGTTTASIVPIDMVGPAITLNYATGTVAGTATANVILAGTTPFQGGITLINSSSSPSVDYPSSTTVSLNLGNVMRPFNVPRGNTANSFDLRIRGPVQGGSATGGIQKIGSGILRFDNAASPFTGTLEVTEGQVLGSTTAGTNNQFTGLPALVVDGPTGDFHTNGGQTQTFSSVSMTAGTLSASNTLSTVLASSYTFNVAAGSSATAVVILGDSPAGPSPLTMSGAGIAYLTGANTYTGGTTILSGTLSVGNGGTNGTFGGNVTDNGTLAFNHSNILTFAGSISGSGGVVQQGINNLVLAGNNSYAGGTTISGGSVTATTDGNLGATGGTITLSGGAFTPNGPITSVRNFIVTATGGSVALASANGFTTTGTANGAGTLVKSGAGELTVSSFSLGGLNVSAGAVAMAANGTRVGVTSLLTIGDNTAATTAKLDLNDNDLIVNYSGTSPIGTVRNLLIAGYNGGAWTGNGITSTFAQSHAGQGLGYGEASDVGVTNLDGVSIPGSAVIVKYTYYGDSSLDGKVDLGNDFNLFLQGFLGTNSVSGWEGGDYNYDGHTDVSDFQLFVDGFAANGGQLGELAGVIENESALTASQKATLLAVVPEPSSAALIAVAACGLVRRRRKID